MNKGTKSLSSFDFLKLVMRQSSGKVSASIFCVIIAQCLEGIGFILFLPLIQAFAGASDGSPDLSPQLKFLQSWLPRVGGDSFAVLLTLIIVVFACKNLFLYISKWFSEYVAVEFEEELRKKVVSSSFAANLDFYLNEKIGTLLNAATNQAVSASQAFRQLMKLCAGILNIIVFCAVGFLISWRMFLLSVAGGFLAFILLKNVIQTSRRVAKSIVGIRNDCQNLVLENLGAIKFIKGNHLVEARQKGLFQLFDHLKKQVFRNYKYHAAVEILPDFIIAFIMCAIFYISYVYLKVPGQNILVLIVVLYQMNRRILSLQVEWQKLLVQMPSFELCNDLIENAQRVRERTGERKFASLKESIRADRLSFSYGRETVLRSVTFEIKKNELTAIVGRSGSGKTTILDLIMGLFKSQEGNIRLDGVDMNEYDIFSWREKISYVPQEPFLFNGSIRDNICVGKAGASEEEIVRASKLASASEFIDKLPQNYDTLVGERGVKLSGGQRQRIALARALIRDPQVLILDEATSSLDNESERMVKCTLEALKGNLTLLVVAHRLTTIENADMIYVLEGGEIIESGKAGALASNRQFFHMLYGADSPGNP